MARVCVATMVRVCVAAVVRVTLRIGYYQDGVYEVYDSDGSQVAKGTLSDCEAFVRAAQEDA